jgi:CheY-like chemotaxis protein
MSRQNQRTVTILVADDVEETRDGIQGLLEADGYRVDPARSEAEVVVSACRHRPDLILLSLGESQGEATASAQRIRRLAELGDNVPVVFFCMPTVDEGAEVALGRNVFVTRPDNFDQLRRFLGRLLSGPSPSGV